MTAVRHHVRTLECLLLLQGSTEKICQRHVTINSLSWAPARPVAAARYKDRTTKNRPPLPTIMYHRCCYRHRPCADDIFTINCRASHIVVGSTVKTKIPSRKPPTHAPKGGTRRRRRWRHRRRWTRCLSPKKKHSLLRAR